MLLWTLLVAAAVTLVFGAGSRAAPDATVQRLMGEPVSLLDLGVLRLTDDVQRFRNSIGWFLGTEIFGLGVSYDWGRNTVVVLVQQALTTSNEPPPTITKAQCRKVIDLLRPTLAGTTSSAFSHLGYTRPELAEAAGDMVDLVLIRVRFFNLSCEARLGADDPVLFTE